MNSPSPNIGSRFTPVFNSNLISPDCKSNLYDNNRDLIKGKKLDFNEEIIKFGQSENDLLSKNKENYFTVNDKNNFNINSNQLEINNQNNFECNGNNNNIITQLNNNNINRYYSNNNSYKPDIRNKTQNKITCTCQKTKCQKKYCACFASGLFCQGCDCKDCCNKPENQNDNNNNNNNNNNINSNNININEEKISYNKINNEKKNQRPICNCTKSNCVKKYCECFKQGIACDILCRCVDCMNKNDFRNNNNINDNGFSGNVICNEIQRTLNNQISVDNNINMNINNTRILSCEAMGILIEKKKIKIEKRNVILDDTKNNNNVNDIKGNKVNILNGTPKYSNKKRARQKNELANEKTCPTTNSNSDKRNKTKIGISQVNKNIKKKILQLS